MKIELANRQQNEEEPQEVIEELQQLLESEQMANNDLVNENEDLKSELY